MGNDDIAIDLKPAERPDWPCRPRPVAQALGGAFVTALAAGPVTFVLGWGILTVNGAVPFAFSVTVSGLIQGIFYTSLFGLVGSVPAAIINTLILGWLARRGRDHIRIAIGSGLVLGTIVGLVVCTMLLSLEINNVRSVEKVVEVLWLALAFTGTGGLMGALHWRIAIRPRRRWRLLQEQERIGVRAME